MHCVRDRTKKMHAKREDENLHREIRQVMGIRNTGDWAIRRPRRPAAATQWQQGAGPLSPGPMTTLY